MAFARALVPIPAAIHCSDPSATPIPTVQGCSEALPDFLNCCHIIVHHNPAVVLTDPTTSQLLTLQANMFPWKPTEHFHHDVLGPLFTTLLLQGGYMASFYNYVEDLLLRAGVLI
jgi:hypothetical protein